MKPTTVKWLLTRDVAAAEREAQLLRERGVDACPTPCIAFVEHPWPQWNAARGQTVILITSKRAAQAWLATREYADVVAAMAPSTAAYLTNRGVRVDVTARGGVLSLAEALTQMWHRLGTPEWHFRYPTSDAGLEREEQQDAITLLSTIGPVERRVVYETRAVEDLSSVIADALDGSEWSVCFASPSAVDAFLDNRPAAPRPPTHVVCFGRSTVLRWDERRPPGWRAALLTQSVVDTVVSLEETP